MAVIQGVFAASRDIEREASSWAGGSKGPSDLGQPLDSCALVIGSKQIPYK